MKMKFDKMDTAELELRLIFTEIDVKIEKMVESSDEEERKHLADQIYFLEEDIRSLMRKVVHKGRIYRKEAKKN